MPDSPRCPGCGQRLQPSVLGAATPPWQCQLCRRGWWNAELTPDARLAYQPAWRTHTGPDAPGIAAAVDQEHAAARQHEQEATDG